MKKIVYSLGLSLIPVVSLPISSVISCSGTTQLQITDEMAELNFLTFKTTLISEAQKFDNPDAFKESILNQFGYFQEIDYGLTKFDVKLDNDGYFIVDYENVVFSGKIEDFSGGDLQNLPKTRKTLTGTLKVKAKTTSLPA